MKSNRTLFSDNSIEYELNYCKQDKISYINSITDINQLKEFTENLKKPVPCIVLDYDNKYIEVEGRYKLCIPIVKGNPYYFYLNPNFFGGEPYGYVEDGILYFNIHLNENIKEEIENNIEKIKTFVEKANNIINEFNLSLLNEIEQRLKAKREEFAKNEEIIKKLGIPVKRI